MEAGDLGSHLHAELGVEVGERLVHEEGGRLAHDRSSHGDPLALTTGELAGPLSELLGEFEDACRFLNPCVDFGLRCLGELEGETDVVPHGHVGVERIVLEHHRDVAILGLDIVDDVVADAHLAAGDLLEAGDHAECGGLAAA